jgi:predicted metal-dependent peptidase
MIPNNSPPGPTPAEKRALVDRVAALRTGLTMWAPFFGHLLLKMDPVVAGPNHHVKTAAVTRDRRLYLNHTFCSQLSDAELLFVMCHEVMHLAYLCFPRGESRKAIVAQLLSCGACGAKGKVIVQGQEAKGPQVCPACQGQGVTPKPVSLWNIAHDFAINDIIDQMSSSARQQIVSIKMPKGGLLDPKYRDWSAEDIYDALLTEAEKNGSMSMPGQGQPQQGQGQGQGQGQQGQGLSQVPQDAWGVEDIRSDLGGEGAGDGDEDGEDPGTQGMSEAEQNELDEYWKVALVEAAQVHEQRGKGSLPANLRKLIEEITDPKVPWADVLSRWVGENGRRADFSFRRPSRRSESVLGTNGALPSMQRHGVDDIVVLWDTSGSMGGRETEIMSEVIGICEDLNLKLRVICCDTRVASDNHDVEYAEDVNWAGGGGSNFIPAFDLLHKERYEGVLIAFTDGWIDVPSTKPPNIREVLWVLWEGRDVDPTRGRWGEVITVDKEGNVV